MSTQEQNTPTLHDNELIAEFMGFARHPTNPKRWYYNGTPTTNNYGVYELAYHNEWEWLMPVVESIGKMGYLVQMQFDIAFTDPAACIILKRGKPTVSIKGQDLHECVYQSVVCVIKIYNSESKHP